jgi:hypothetical protein
VWLLEECFRIPFTRVRFGVEPIVGLVPVLGDLLGVVGGLPILAAALRRRLPLRVVLVMTVNLLFDAVVGSVPVAGDVFDLLWKANRKNLELLEDPARLRAMLREAGSRVGLLVVLALALCAILALVLVALLVAAEWTWGAR